MNEPDGNFVQFKKGNIVEAVVEGDTIGIIPYRIHVSEKDGEHFGVWLCNFSMEDFPVLVHLLITDKSSLHGWLAIWSHSVSSSTFDLLSTGLSKFKVAFSDDFLSFCLASSDDCFIGSGDAKLTASSSSSEKSKTTLLLLVDLLTATFI
ncbi:hypothetical protein Lal_00018282 [Lupinus albus]|nr:hypothetical protein Lal_00018282 [Lupinus albus]